MLFNSLEFIFFFPIIIALYFIINYRYRWVMLLLASYYFYMCWSYKYIVLILLSTIIDYVAGILMYKTSRQRLRTLFLLASLGTNLGLLFFFKYFNFIGNTLSLFLDKISIDFPFHDYLLPVGISFYTFQTLSYTIDIYKKERTPEYHFGRFALFVSFFPQLVAGPIERSVNLLPQFRKRFYFEYERVKNGILLMCWGFFKKVVIADRLAEYVDQVYAAPEKFDGLHNILATIFFSFQIYCDFSGYSDIAIGAALIMGYKLMTNFRRPYLATSIREFWQRWHISLSTWFRDYVYIPLGGNRVAKWRWYYNLFITFVISGFWHGANWNFLVWGALHGFYLIFAIWTVNIRNRINNSIGLTSKPQLLKTSQIIVTFILVYFAWIFFRSNQSMDQAFVVIKSSLNFNLTSSINLFRIKSEFFIAIISIVLLIFIEVFEERYSLYEKLKLTKRPVKWILLIILLFCVIALGRWEESDFLYFQF